MAELRPLVALFTKPPRPGRVKTRLVGGVTPSFRERGSVVVDAEMAAVLHAAFLDDLAERLVNGGVGSAFDLQVAWDLEDGDDLPSPPISLAGLPGVDVVRQEGADLGERLEHALSAASIDHPAVAAIGSDLPTLAPETVLAAFAAVGPEGRSDVALGPSEDGGYYLVALARRAVHPRLFAGIDWSTPRVLGQTLDRCAELGLSVHLLPPARDVDTGEDLLALAAELAAGGGPDCPRTRRLLAEWGLLPAAVAVAAGGG